MGNLQKTIWIDAAPEIVHSYFTDSVKYARWVGRAAKIDATPGGTYALDMGEAGHITGRFVSVAPEQIVIAIEGDPADPPNRIDIRLAAEAGGCRVTIEHEGIPDPFALIAGRGWDHHLARLSVVASGGAPGPDTLCQRGMDTLA